MHVRQAANVLELLEYFAKRRTPSTLAEISDDLGWPRSSTFNLVSTLIAKGYLYEPKHRAGYYPSPRWLSMAQQVVDAQPLPDEMAMMARELSEELRETTAIVAGAGTFAVFIHVVEPKQPIRYFAEIGHRTPIHASSSGRAILQQMAPAERRSLLRKVRFEPYTKTSPLSIEEVEAEVRRGAERGYQRSLGEYSHDLLGVAIPLPYRVRRLSFVVGGPMFRLQDRMEDIAAMLHQAVARFGIDTIENG